MEENAGIEGGLLLSILQLKPCYPEGITRSTFCVKLNLESEFARPLGYMPWHSGVHLFGFEASCRRFGVQSRGPCRASVQREHTNYAPPTRIHWFNLPPNMLARRE